MIRVIKIQRRLAAWIVWRTQVRHREGHKHNAGDVVTFQRRNKKKGPTPSGTEPSTSGYPRRS
jgi:hypothetical protein